VGASQSQRHNCLHSLLLAFKWDRASHATQISAECDGLSGRPAPSCEALRWTAGYSDPARNEGFLCPVNIGPMGMTHGENMH